MIYESKYKIVKKRETFTLKILSKSNKIEEIIKNIKNENIKESYIEKTYMKDGFIVSIAKIIVIIDDEETIIPIELFKRLNEKFTEEDKEYLELTVKREE
ncbi:hypothetical protein [Clostridium baratii]|uniref:hypothetical protein n=1 Tax=Clostridium baratii TaxID=1561 RepID=UPI0030D0C3DB